MTDRQDSRIFQWAIDREDKIIQVNDAWLAFARENAAPHLATEAVLNRPLWDFISGLETINLYQLIFEKVRHQKLSLTIPFRCDSPDCRRFMEMQVSALQGDQLQFHSRIIRQEFRPAVAILDASVSKVDQFLLICSWCKRIQVSPGRWEEIEVAVKSLELFAIDRLPQLSHGICDACYARLQEDLAN